jgi:hypothetical protein
MFWKKKEKEPDTSAIERTCGHQLYEYLCAAVQKDGRIRVEDLITAISSVIAEVCIEAAGDFNPRKHQFAPGARVFSTKVNELFCGDVDDLNKVPSETIVGMLRDYLSAAGYNKADFPSLGEIFRFYAANVGKAGGWGKAPLSIPDNNNPFILPLQIAYESRLNVDRTFQPLTNPQQKLRASVLALIEALIAVKQVINNKTVLTLALETINGMAKTAPMTDDAVAAAKRQA